MRDSFRRRTNTSRNRTSQRTASANARRAATEDGSEARYRNRSALGRAASDFAMDVGLTQRDNQYYANLANRQEASQQALADMRRRRDRRRNRTDDTTETKPTEEVTNVTENTSTTTLDPTTDTSLTNVENISNQTFSNNDNISNYFDNTATSLVNTAAGQEQNQASALTTSVGEAEDEAISYMTTGTASNVLNPGGAQGLLGGDDEDEDDPFNRRKTLIGA